MEIRPLGNQLPWPDVFNVTILDLGGETYAYRVVTWFSESKAVAIAVQHHQSTIPPTSTSERRIYDVRVERIGPADKDEQGAMQLDGADLVDRMEF
jgi:hypothetical protein